MNRLIDFLTAHNVKSIAVFSHIRADGDSLGAQTGLAQLLRELEYDVELYNQYQELSPDFYYLKNYEEIKHFTSDSKTPDICIAVDCASRERIGQYPEQLDDLLWINIDHHISNTLYADLNIVEPNASSTCEVLSELFINDKNLISKDIATSFYTGLSTDTGSFLYQNTSAKTLRLAASMIESGANISDVRANIYENMSHIQLKIYKYLYSNIEFSRDNKIAYCAFSKQTLNQLHASTSDLEGVVSKIKNIQGVEVAILFTENQEQHIKISMRSKEYFDVNKICSLLGGGGHIRASGASYDGNLSTCISHVLSLLDSEWED